MRSRRFGYPSLEALAEGRNGVDCRGEEHDVTVVWSLTSGKRQLSMDGKEITYSSSRSGVFDFSWTTRGNHVIKVVCHAAAPLTATPGFRQYDLFIDGQSFFIMPKVYELGIKGPNARVPGHAYSNQTSPTSMGSGYQGRAQGNQMQGVPTTRDQEEADLRRAIEASINESRQHLQGRGGDDARSAYTTPQAGTADLLDFGAPALALPASDARSVSSMPSAYSAPPSYNQAPPTQAPPSYSPAPYQSPHGYQQANPVASPHGAVGPGALVPSHGPPGYSPGYYQAPPTTPSYASPPPVPPAPAPTPQHHYTSAPVGAPNPMHYQTQNTEVFGLNSPAAHDPFAPRAPPPPTRQDLASAILGAYQSPSAASAPQTPAAGTHPNGFSTSPNQQNGGYSPGDPAAGVSMSMNALSVAQEEGPVNPFDKALKNLVNFDHIDEPAEGELRLTMMKKEEEKKKHPKGKSRPLPPLATDMVGQNAPLSQINQMKQVSSVDILGLFCWNWKVVSLTFMLLCS